VDDFTLVSAFFMFVIGCMNMLLGLIFRESAKSRRSITSWREEAKVILPTTNLPSHLDLNRSATSGSGRSFTSSTMCEEKSRDLAEFGAGRSNSRAGYGFGRQGEKAAGLRGQSLFPIR
jgi:regulatory protein YycI of two-component signal transduction system YycFG